MEDLERAERSASNWGSEINAAFDEASLIVALINLERTLISNPQLIASIGKAKVMEVCNRKRRSLENSWSSRVSYRYGLLLQLFVDVENGRPVGNAVDDNASDVFSMAGDEEQDLGEDAWTWREGIKSWRYMRLGLSSLLTGAVVIPLTQLAVIFGTVYIAPFFGLIVTAMYSSLIILTFCNDMVACCCKSKEYLPSEDERVLQDEAKVFYRHLCSVRTLLMGLVAAIYLSTMNRTGDDFWGKSIDTIPSILTTDQKWEVITPYIIYGAFDTLFLISTAIFYNCCV
jgi:hypothetical protein